MKAALVVDLGGTWMRATLRARGEIVRHVRLPAVPWKLLPRALISLRSRWRFAKLENLIVGSRGVWKQSERKSLARSLSAIARRIRVVSDLELAHEESFGGGSGILIVAGTGSAAYGRDERGRTARGGGLGPLLGDEGSAFWVGREALKDPRLSRRWPPGLALRLAHGPDAVRRTAQLAKLVFRWAQRDKAARNLRVRAAEELARLGLDLSRRLEFSGKIPIAWRGGLFENPDLRREVIKALNRESPRFEAPGRAAARRRD